MYLTLLVLILTEVSWKIILSHYGGLQFFLSFPPSTMCYFSSSGPGPSHAHFWFIQSNSKTKDHPWACVKFGLRPTTFPPFQDNKSLKTIKLRKRCRMTLKSILLEYYYSLTFLTHIYILWMLKVLCPLRDFIGAFLNWELDTDVVRVVCLSFFVTFIAGIFPPPALSWSMRSPPRQSRSRQS